MPDTKYQFKDDTLYPPDASMRGDNAHYLDYCETGGHRPGYAVCLNKIKAQEEGRLVGQLGNCEGAIGLHRCPAFHMRDKERLEGRALFYVNRSKLNAHIAELNKLPLQSEFLNELKEAQSSRKSQTKKQEPARPVAPAPIVASGSYAAAINAAMAETLAEAPAAPIVATPEPVTAAPKPAAAPALKPMPGESLLEFAKRQREARATA